MMKNIFKSAPPKNTATSAAVELEAKALAKFNAGQYRDAIECYKTLLKQSNNLDWQKKMADCYLRRSLTLAEKGMLKEATVMWENYSQNAKPPYQAFDNYIIWQLQNNNTAKIRSCLSQLTAQQLDERYSELAALLGLLMLSERTELAAALPQDSQLLTHLSLAQAALDAYRNNEINIMEEVLAKLPFRSAFRDFRTLLKAALMLPVSIKEASALLAKIPDTSPYQPVVSLLQILNCQGAALVKQLLALDPKQRKLITIIKGFSKKQEELLSNLSQNKELTDKIKFGLAIKYRDVLGEDLSERFCQATLAVYPAGQRDFNKAFNNTDSFAVKRFKALYAEHDTHEAERYWLEAIDILKDRNDPESAFKIALIMRHIALFYPPNDPSWWVKSLEYDPDDRETNLKVIQLYERQGLDNNQFKEWLAKGLAKFPSDLDFLMLAIQEALYNKAFKKAAQYAKNILTIDPVNTYAKQTLFRCHLAHARKLLISKKFHLVENELKQAQSLVLGKRYLSLIELMRGFLVFLNEDQNQGLKLITATAQKIDDSPVNAQFVAAMEALLLQVPPAPLLKGMAAIPKKYLLSPQELTRLIELIQQYAKEDDAKLTNTHKALANISAVLKASIKQQSYSEDELLAFCQGLENIKHFELLLYCAKIARAKWHKPIWMYYQAYAEAKGDAKNCKASSIRPLEHYLEQHRGLPNERATLLIGQFVESYYQAHSPGLNLKGLERFFGSSNGGDADEYDDPIEDLFDHIPSSVFNKIDARTEVLTKTMGPEKLLSVLGKYLPKKINLMLAVLQEPELFTVLLFMKAADDLGINTGVTIEDVLDYFDLEETGKFPGFPFF